MREESKIKIQKFTSGKEDLYRLEYYLQFACKFGDIDCPEQELWCLIDDVMGTASIDERDINQQEIDMILRSARELLQKYT